MKHCLFFDLPPEIREKIYIYVVFSPTQPILLNAPHAHVSFPLNVLLVNTQIYHEARPLYFAANTFAITLLRRNETWDYVLSPLFLDNIRQMRSLRLNIIRWGPKNFFVDELVPVLEACIMSGRLREVEVRMRDVWMKGECFDGRWNWNMRVGEQNANWESLMRVLRDPYLECVKLMAGPLDGAVGDDGRSYVEDTLIPFRNVKWVFDFEEGGGWRKVANS